MVNLKNIQKNKNIGGYLKPLYRLANILAIAPPYDFDSVNKQKKSISYTYYSMVVAIFILTTYSYGMYGATSKIYKSSQTTTIVIQILYYFFLVTSNMISITGSSFQNWRNWHNMLDICKKIEKQQNSTMRTKISYAAFNFHILFGHFMLFVVLSYDTYVGQQTFGINLYQYYICFRCQYYFVFISVILICYFALEIKTKFESFNKILQKITSNERLYVIKNKGNSISPITLGSFSQLSSLKNITRMFSVLSELVDLYNKIFGWQILILMGVVLMALLESFNFIMVYGISQKEDFGRNYPVDMIVQSLATTLVFLVWGILVIICCDLANKEIHNSATISFQLLPEISDTSNEVKKLLFLAQQAANRCPQLTAANVFTVNISTLFALFGSITTYVVVVIQFNTM